MADTFHSEIAVLVLGHLCLVKLFSWFVACHLLFGFLKDGEKKLHVSSLFMF